MSKHFASYETRSADPIETRNDDDTDIAAAIAAVTELRSAVETRQAAADERLATELRSVTERLDAIDVRTQRPGATELTDAVPVERRAFGTFLRRGREGLPADELRALTESTAPNAVGAAIAPPTFATEVITGLVQYSPIREYARVLNISTGEIRFPVRTGTTQATWVGEIANRTESEPTFDQLSIVPGELATFTEVSNWLLEDASFDLEQFLRNDFAEAFGKSEAIAFVSGDGVGKPQGLLTPSNGIPQVAGGKASTIDYASFVALFHSLPSAYAKNATWVLNLSTIAAARSLVDGNGRPIWGESMAAGQPATIFGRPVVEAVDFPGVAANTLPIFFGDLAQTYLVVDRLDLSVLRDPYSRAKNGITVFHARKRVGGKVVKPEAGRLLKVATTVS